MTCVYNLCIKQTVLPTALENAKVVPVPQSNDLSDSCNYIPIYVLPVLSKPLERHIHKHLLQYLETDNIIHHYHQSGFRPNHYCHTAQTRLCDAWLSAINCSDTVCAVFRDIEKAFYLVDLYSLLRKL